MHFYKSKSRHILFFKFYFLIISFINPSFLIYGYELCEAKESCYKDEKLNTKIAFKNKLNKKINSEVSFFNEKNINPLEIFLAFTNENFNQSSIEIEANEQSETKDKIIAKGNVIIKSNGAILLTDFIEYEKNKKLLKSRGKIKFINKNQIFISDYFEYNFSDKSGFINNIYGVIDLKTLTEDIDLKQKPISDSRTTSENFNNVRLDSEDPIGLNFNNLRENSSSSFLNFNTSRNRVQKWRFKSKKIDINNSLINSKKIIFTNDAFNPPQLKLIAHNVYSRNNKNKTIFISRWTTLILDDKLSLPLGRRRISDGEGKLNKISIGIDNEEKDGLFISRISDTFKFRNLDFKFIPELYLQRILEDETYSFRQKDESITSPKIKNQITPIDYFGGKILIDGKIASYRINSRSSINSLDINKLNESLRSSISLSKNLRNKNHKNLELNYFASYREKIDTGYHGIHEIYNGYGLNLKNSFNKTHNKSNWSSTQNLSLGKFKADNHQGNLATHTRTSLGGNIRNAYTIWKSSSKDKYIDNSYKFVPGILKNELNLVSDINLAINNYSNYESQNIIRFSIGPELTIGNYRNHFLDYTSLVTFLEITSKSGSSPFKFDNLNDDLKLYLSLNQQLIKSLSLGVSSYFNIDKSSNKYSKFINTKYALNWNRRAYNFQFYYEEDTKNAGFNFTIFGMPFDGLGKIF